MPKSSGKKDISVDFFKRPTLLLNHGCSRCMFLQRLFGTVMESWTWCYWYFQCGIQSLLLQEVFQCTSEKGNSDRMQCWSKTSFSTEYCCKD